MLQRLAILPLLLIAVLGTSCSSDPRTSRTEYLGGRVVETPIVRESRPVYDNVSYWDGDGVPGSPSIIIKLSEQRAYFYKSGTLVGVSSISTGREGYGTPTGSFKIIQKNKDHRSNLYGDYVDSAGNVVVKDIAVKKDPKPAGTTFRGASMPYFMRVVGGTGMHAGFLPGYPASHGCIRMPEFMAENFFAAVSMGTPVKIVH